jgi:hypothetical protein
LLFSKDSQAAAAVNSESVLPRRILGGAQLMLRPDNAPILRSKIKLTRKDGMNRSPDLRASEGTRYDIKLMLF